MHEGSFTSTASSPLEALKGRYSGSREVKEDEFRGILSGKRNYFSNKKRTGG